MQSSHAECGSLAGLIFIPLVAVPGRTYTRFIMPNNI